MHFTNSDRVRSSVARWLLRTNRFQKLFILFILFGMLQPQRAMAVTNSYTTAGYTTWTAPANVNSTVDVACWGGGGQVLGAPSQTTRVVNQVEAVADFDVFWLTNTS